VAIINSQIVKTSEVSGPRGYDTGENINGRKHHIVVGTLGLILAIVVQPADGQDQEGAVLVLGILKRFVVLPKRWTVGRTFGWIG